MATVTQIIGTRTELTSTGFSTLASATYVATAAYNCNTNKPVDVAVEVACATTNTPTGNKQVAVFLKESIDGTNFRSGPESGSSATDEPNLRYLGVIPMNTASVTQRETFSVRRALGYVPHSFKVVLKNDLGVALTGGNVYTSEVSVVSA